VEKSEYYVVRVDLLCLRFQDVSPEGFCLCLFEINTWSWKVGGGGIDRSWVGEQ
jgi:hypothetical protein